jgi:hypothetical protein
VLSGEQRCAKRGDEQVAQLLAGKIAVLRPVDDRGVM